MHNTEDKSASYREVRCFFIPILTGPKSRNYGTIEDATLEKKAKWNEEETHGT
nr:MAG TPA: hypothetical protein [Caudoviricetes sp.]